MMNDVVLKYIYIIYAICSQMSFDIWELSRTALVW